MGEVGAGEWGAPRGISCPHQKSCWSLPPEGCSESSVKQDETVHPYRRGDAFTCPDVLHFLLKLEEIGVRFNLEFKGSPHFFFFFPFCRLTKVVKCYLLTKP